MRGASAAKFGWSVLLACALSACGYLKPTPVERILQDGDCATVPDIERLAITVSDHGAKVSFQWSGTRFAGMVQTSTAALARDASYGTNQIGEWDRKFPDVSATTTIPDSYLGFPAASNPRAGVLAAAVYDVQYPAANETNRAVVVVDLKTKGTVLLVAPRRVNSIAISPKGDYLAVLEIAPAAKLSNWRDLFVWDKSKEGPRYDVYATVFSISGLAACTREVTAGVPSPIVNVVWGS